VKNAASAPAEALVRAHKELLQDLQNLEAMTLRPAAKGPAELIARLERACTDLAAHFQLEEENGYLEDLRRRSPHLEHEIEQLRQEHRDLARSLKTVLAAAREGTAAEEAVRQEVRHWINSVRKHERHENRLVQDAYNVDLGPED
jgi:hemerythrin